MSHPKPIVRPLRPTESDVAARRLTLAFDSDPALHWLLPDAEHRAEAAPRIASAYVEYALRHGIVWCTDDLSGVALRRPPGEERLHAHGILTSGLAWLPFHLGWAGTLRLLEVEEKTSRWHEDALGGPHWYLWTIAVDPARQGEGIGSALMRHTFATADADGLPCYLETTHPRALAIHRSHGFEVVHEARIRGELPVWSMVRPARRAS